MTDIPRQTHARRQVRRASVEVEANPDGTYTLWSPGAPGWKAHVTSNPQAGQALHDALLENQIAAYARAHGATYDHAAMTAHDPDDPSTHATLSAVPRNRRGSRVSLGWSENDDGSLTSPAGHRYARDSQTARRVLAAWHRDGPDLPPTGG